MRYGAVLRGRIRQHPSRRLRAERESRPRPTRAPRARVQRFVNARLGERDRLHQGHDRGDHPGCHRAGVGRSSARATTRSCSRYWSTTPISCRGSCCARSTGIVLKVVPTDEHGAFLLDAYEGAGRATHQAGGSLTHVSNVLGTVVPVAEVVRIARDATARKCADRRRPGHRPPTRRTYRRWTWTVYCFSGHKLYGPSGHRRASTARRRCSPPCRPTRAAAT